MAKKNPRAEIPFSSFLIDPDNPESGFKEVEVPALEIKSTDGQPEGKKRHEPRFTLRGAVLLHCSNKRVIRAESRDVSIGGIGITLKVKVKSYLINEQFTLEFTPPHKLQSILLPVELTRCTKLDKINQLGFRILPMRGSAQSVFTRFINELMISDPWF